VCADAAADAAALRAQLAAGGALGLDRVRVVDGCHGTGRGLVAAAPLAVAEQTILHPGATELLAVPYDLLVTADAARASPTAGAALREIEGLDDDTVLLLFVVHEVAVLGAASRWAAYWPTLPTRFITGLALTDADLAVLDAGGAEVAASIRTQQAQLTRVRAYPSHAPPHPTHLPTPHTHILCTTTTTLAAIA
jgi:hypothetical protein